MPPVGLRHLFFVIIDRSFYLLLLVQSICGILHLMCVQILDQRATTRDNRCHFVCLFSMTWLWNQITLIYKSMLNSGQYGFHRNDSSNLKAYLHILACSMYKWWYKSPRTRHGNRIWLSKNLYPIHWKYFQMSNYWSITVFIKFHMRCVHWDRILSNTLSDNCGTLFNGQCQEWKHFFSSW